MPFPWAAAITAGGALYSSIAGDDEAKKQNRLQKRAIEKANKRAEKRDDTKIQRLVADARAAGIHPLAALGSSVAGSFATPMAAFGGAPISGSAVGDAIKAFGAAMPDPNGNADLQTQLMKAQIANVNASTAQLLADAQSRTKISNAQSTDTYRLFGLDMAENPAFSDAQVLQNRIGEPAEWVMAPFIALADAYQSAGSTWREAVELARQDIQKQMRARGVLPR